MSSDQIDHAKVVSELFRDITAHTSYEKLKGILDQNVELRDKVKKLTTTLEVNLESLHNAKAKLDKSCQELQKKDEQVQSLQKEADHLGSILTAKTHELKAGAQNITKTEDALKRAEFEIEDLRKSLEEERKKTQDREAIEQELELTRHELDHYRQEIKKLENFSVPLKPACTRVEEM